MKALILLAAILFHPAKFQEWFTSVNGTQLKGQVLSLDFTFDQPVTGALWVELILQTGPSSAKGDYPYTQYVVPTKVTAYLLPSRKVFSGFGVIKTTKGMAGTDVQFDWQTATGIHFDVTLPKEPKSRLYEGRLAVKF